ncbi:MAG: hypothetical protein HAW66_00310 [Shewanella sp.]|nr:hypothetical protein [Shewanella sp.]
MSFYLRALRHGVMRLFTLPRLTLPVLVTLSLTLAAVLAVVAISSNLIFKPLPDIKDEDSLYIIGNKVDIGSVSIDVFNEEFVSRLADKYQLLGDFATLENEQTHVSFNISDTLFDTINFTATHNIFDVLGRDILLGEIPNPDNIKQGAWISESLWRGALEKRKNVIGDNITIGDKKYLITGVVKDFVSFKSNGKRNLQQVWSLYNLENYLKKNDGNGSFGVNFKTLFRIKSRLITEQKIDDYWAEFIDKQSPNSAISSLQLKITLSNYRDALLLSQEKMVWFLIVASVALLLMACLNLLNLFIGYYQQRQREFALQISLGASKVKLSAMVFLENLPVFILSALTGLILAEWTIRTLPIISGGNIKFLELIHLDWQTSVIAIMLVMSINFFFSIMVIFRINDETLLEQVSSGSKGVTGQSMGNLSKAIFVLQISAAAIMLTTMAMVGKAAWEDLNIDYGFIPGNTLIIRANLNEHFREFDSEDLEKQHEQSKSYILANREIKRQIINKIQMAESNINVLNSDSDPYIAMNGYISLRFDSEKQTSVSFRVVDASNDYIERFHIPLLYGRNITNEEFETFSPVQLVNETLAKQLSKDELIESVLGTRFHGNEIIGVIADNIRSGEHKTKFSAIFTPSLNTISSVNFVMQLPESISFDVTAIESLIQKSHPQITEIRSFILKDYMSDQLKDKRLQFYFIMALSLLTLVLAAFGTSGMALSFAEIKRFELAIRMATGASRAMLLKNMLKSFSGLLSITIVIALVSSALIYSGLQQQIPALPAFSWDALVFFSAILVTIVFTAIFWVVWRVINAEPMQALREL